MICLITLLIVLCFFQPFIDKDHPFQSYFPDPIYAIAVPATLLVFFIGLVTIFVSVVLLKELSKTKPS